MQRLAILYVRWPSIRRTMYCAVVKAFVSQLLCVALCNRTRRENEGRKSGKKKKSIVLSG